MASAARDFPRFHRLDRNFFLIYAGLIWAGTMGGFALDMAAKFATGRLQYPLIVHAHAVVFVAWLAVFTMQVWLIRSGNTALHRRLGIMAAALIPLMIVLGPATAIVMDGIKYGLPRTSFPSMATQFTNVAASSALLVAGLLLRRDAAAHKRLMLMGTLALMEPGLSRLLVGMGYHGVGDGVFAYLLKVYPGSILLMAGVGAYDWATRRRLHPAYLAALAWCLTNQLTAAWLYQQPWWSQITTRLVGH